MENGEILSGANGQYLTFDFAEERYAVDVASVEVVLEMASITRVPKSASHLRGVINHRGSVIPVVDLRTVFNLPTAESGAESGAEPSIIVTQVEFEGESITTGVLADTVYEVVDLDPSSIEPSPSIGSKIDASCITGIGKRDGGFIIILDLEKALVMAVSELGTP